MENSTHYAARVKWLVDELKKDPCVDLYEVLAALDLDCIIRDKEGLENVNPLAFCRDDHIINEDGEREDTVKPLFVIFAKLITAAHDLFTHDYTSTELCPLASRGVELDGGSGETRFCCMFSPNSFKSISYTEKRFIHYKWNEASAPLKLMARDARQGDALDEVIHLLTLRAFNDVKVES